MSLVKYRAFIHVVEHGSLTKAARLMGYSQPGISKMIESLEDELHVTLFLRNHSSLELTENGKQLYVFCKQIIKYEDALLDTAKAMNGLITGSVRIGALNSIIVEFVPELIRAFSEDYPIIQIYLYETSFLGIIEQLKDNLLDIGFTSKFEAKGLEFIPLFKDPIRLIVNKNHPLASYKTISIKDLNGCDFIMIPSIGDDLINVIKGEEKFTPVVKYYVHSDVAAVAMVSKNLGVYIISELQCDNLPDNVIKLNFEKDVYRIMGIGINSLKTSSPTLKELVKVSKIKAIEYLSL